MAAVTRASGSPGSQLHSPSEGMNTLPDPRSPSISSDASSRRGSTSPHHPDLSSEVANLSNKLINAINHQTNLDDSLASARHELESARERIRQLEAKAQEHAAMVANGILVKRADVDDQTVSLMAKLSEERKQRSVAEKDKKLIEQELEGLTEVLFEEANKMVAAARKDQEAAQEAAERKNEQLRTQLKDTEILLASHQEQLAELKVVMQQMSSDRDEAETNTNNSTAPSTPGLTNQDNLNKVFDALRLSPSTPGMVEIPPAHPTSFTHLIHPVLRTDLQAYDDFQLLLQMYRTSAPPSRVTSGSYSGLNVMSLVNATNQAQSHTLNHAPSNGSTSSLSTAGTHASTPGTPSTAASTNGGASPRDHPLANTPLKDTRFYKRALTEDIEPTLRLDTAPGISWLARRAVLNSMCEGSLIVEPMPASARIYVFSCSLCGEHRKDDQHARTHRFRTSDSDNAQRYPLCDYCLGRVRASGDFLAFLRMIKDGYWRTCDEEGEKLAWEESVRLRERMFWARIGGGVVPASLQAKDTPRSSTEDVKENIKNLDQEVVIDLAQAKELKALVGQKEDPFHSDQKRVSIGKTIITRMESDADQSWEKAKKAAIFDDEQPTSDAVQAKAVPQRTHGLHDTRASKDADIRPNATTQKDEQRTEQANEPRPSLTIPGAFE